MTFNLIFKLYDSGFTVERYFFFLFFFLFLDYSKKEDRNVSPRRGDVTFNEKARHDVEVIFVSHFWNDRSCRKEIITIICEQNLIRPTEIWNGRNRKQIKEIYYISSRQMVIVTLFMQIGRMFLPTIIHFNKRLISRVGKYYSP